MNRGADVPGDRDNLECFEEFPDASTPQARNVGPSGQGLAPICPQTAPAFRPDELSRRPEGVRSSRIPLAGPRCSRGGMPGELRPRTHPGPSLRESRRWRRGFLFRLAGFPEVSGQEPKLLLRGVLTIHRQHLNHPCLRNRPQFDIPNRVAPGPSALPGSGPPRPSAEWERSTRSPALQSFRDLYLGGTFMGSYALPGAVVRRKIRGLLLALLVSALGTVAALVAPPSAHAAENTLGAAAAQSGRYFGTAIARAGWATRRTRRSRAVSSTR